MESIFYKANFRFVANRYEEWLTGRCISKGPISTEIVAEVNGDEIHFELDDIGNIQMLKSFDFEILGKDYCVLADRIQYIHETWDFNPNVPIACNIFYNGSTMQYVRFATTNPDRLVEFYGHLVEFGQAATGKRTAKSDNSSLSAESILKELQGYRMINAAAVMERATNIFNDNADVATIQQAKNIIESLKLFIKAYQLDRDEFEEVGSPMKCKLLMFIAWCNFKIGNLNRAYCIAKQGLDAVDEAMNHSVIVGLPRSTFGTDNLEHLIDTIESNYINEIKDGDDYYKINPEEIDTSFFDDFAGESERGAHKPSKELIKNMIEAISHVQDEFDKAAEHFGDPMRGLQIRENLETFKMPLFFAWRGYKYGWHTDWCKEGDSLFPFMMFEADLKKNTKELLNLLKTQSPFAQIERNSMITDSLISIYTAFINDLDNGTIKL